MLVWEPACLTSCSLSILLPRKTFWFEPAPSPPLYLHFQKWPSPSEFPITGWIWIFPGNCVYFVDQHTSQWRWTLQKQGTSSEKQNKGLSQASYNTHCNSRTLIKLTFQPLQISFILLPYLRPTLIPSLNPAQHDCTQLEGNGEPSCIVIDKERNHTF